MLNEMVVLTVTEIEYKTVVKLMIEKLERFKDEIAEKDAEIEALIAGQETLQRYIAEQKAEIERLEDVNIRLTKAEAIKEFAERLKKETKGLLGANFIDNLVKEMVGDP